MKTIKINGITPLDMRRYAIAENEKKKMLLRQKKCHLHGYIQSNNGLNDEE